MSPRDWASLFPADDIPGILNLVLDCSKSLKKRSDNELEAHLSTRLVNRIQKDKRVRAGPFWYSCVPEYHVPNEDVDKPVSKGRIDICFLSVGGGQTYFAIEAKRLHVTYQHRKSSEVGKYVGDQGMMCFVSSKYSETQEAGAMLGYVFDGNVERAQKSIQTTISKNAKKLKLSKSTTLKKSNIVQRAECVDETRHHLPGRDITMYHLLIPV